MAIDVAGEALHLLPDGAVWWASTQALWLSDLHLGKAAHFRLVPSVRAGQRCTGCRERIIGSSPGASGCLATCSTVTSTGSGSLFAGLCEEFSSWTGSGSRERPRHDSRVLLRESGIRQVGRMDAGPFTFTHDPADLQPGPLVPCLCASGIGWRGQGRLAVTFVRCFHVGGDGPSCRRMAPSRNPLPITERVTGCTPSGRGRDQSDQLTVRVKYPGALGHQLEPLARGG